ncbi:hypothetical protein [Pulveribacter suum]|uniref:Lipoprotein n=1 Tax=Pulveribacter suum TaxID=2116657 RepID=A0A2P1NM78_9BURK|nr:hypothetical protein [Pulveribacter suum]AVP58161.1 hypothetical protein C7H73_11130 [Pulveribacter suum]
MRLSLLSLAAALLVLTGCASSSNALLPHVSSTVTQEGDKAVSVAPERLVCSGGPRCPSLAASWSGAKPGQAQLVVSLPPPQPAVTGIDVHIGNSEVVRLRVRSGDAQDGAQAGQDSRFDVPLRLIDRLAHAPRSWLRLYLAGGASIDETVRSGEERSRASEAMAHFLAAVQTAGGAGQGLQGPSGGLFDRLGVRDK